MSTINKNLYIYFIVVHENLRLAEAQLNSFKQKTGPIIDAGTLPATSDPQVRKFMRPKFSFIFTDTYNTLR